MRLFRWPLRSKTKAVTYTFRLTLPAGEATTDTARRTYAFDVVFEKGMDRERIAKAIALRAREIAQDMAQVMYAEMIAAIDREMGERPSHEKEK